MASNEFNPVNFKNEIEQEIEKEIGKVAGGHVAKGPISKSKGSTRDAHVYHIEFAEFAGMQVAKKFMKNYEHDIKGKYRRLFTFSNREKF